MITEAYKDLIVKRDAFKRGEDIWETGPRREKEIAVAAKVYFDYLTHTAASLLHCYSIICYFRRRKDTNHNLPLCFLDIFCEILSKMYCFQLTSASQRAAAVAVGDHLKREIQTLRRSSGAETSKEENSK